MSGLFPHADVGLVQVGERHLLGRLGGEGPGREPGQLVGGGGEVEFG